jgi:hypothetical protein
MREAAATDAGIHNSICGPMVNVDLTPANNPPQPRSLDYVDITEYCRRWRAAGAVVGHIRSGKFVPSP